ncbi:MAG: hypothetical protein WAV41_00665 [Microgenomates group bacterium]
MKKIIIVSVMVLVILGIAFIFSKSKTGSTGGCSQFSNKDGYTGCMSLKNGKENRCKFKINNKVNEATQQMEFEYLCAEK